MGKYFITPTYRMARPENNPGRETIWPPVYQDEAGSGNDAGQTSAALKRLYVHEDSYDTALPIIKYSTVDEAVERANALDVRLGGSLSIPDSSLDLGFAEAGFSQLTSGENEFMLDKVQMNVLLDQFQTLSDLFVDMVWKTGSCSGVMSRYLNQ